MPLWLRHWLQVACKSNRMARTAGAFAATADGVCRGRECGNEQRSHVISSFLHVVHANGAQQQAAGAPMWPTAAALHQPRLQSGRQAAALLVCQLRSLVAAAFGPATGWLSRISSPPWQ